MDREEHRLLMFPHFSHHHDKRQNIAPNMFNSSRLFMLVLALQGALSGLDFRGIYTIDSLR